MATNKRAGRDIGVKQGLEQVDQLLKLLRGASKGRTRKIGAK
jgi:hypothetical protein